MSKIIILIIHFSILGCTELSNIRLENYNLDLSVEDYSTIINDSSILEKLKGKKRVSNIKSIVLHNTNDISKEEYIQRSVLSGFGIHLLIAKDGKFYGNQNPHLVVHRATPKLDSSTIHISIEGNEEEILKNQKQLNMAGTLIKKLSNDFSIPYTNKDINSESGVFSHIQSKKKFGNFIDLNEYGIEKILNEILTSTGGKYYSEEEWVGRFEKDWTLRKEKKNSKKVELEFDRGREITLQNKIELDELEKNELGFTPEAFRLKYIFKQKINPTCVVLHFTAISSFKISQDTLERRKLSATIMVDNDSKAYQLLDFLEDQAQAASGTNQDCIQIEIVGKNTDELLSNEKQFQKVVLLVKSLSKKYSIPIQNYKIEELKGIYSHTQAKKKWGGSVALYGKDFDPGEEYMKKVIQASGGKYYEEKNWYNRNSDDWIMYNAEFQP